MKFRVGRCAVCGTLSVLLAIACQGKASPQPGLSSSAQIAIASASAAPEASNAAEAPKPARGIELVQSARIAKLALDANGQFVAELERTPPARSLITLATKEAPLL